MRPRHAARIIAAGILVVAGLSWVADAGAGQRGGPPAREPLPQGQRLDARDGDVVTVEDDARVRLVRRRQAVVRAVFNPTERSVTLLIDHASPGGADGRVDRRFWYSGLSGQWPLPDRWEGTAVVEEYQAIGQPTQGLGLLLPKGLIQILGPMSLEMFKDAGAIAVVIYQEAKSGTVGGVDFDEAERAAAESERNQGTQSRAGRGNALEARAQSRARRGAATRGPGARG
jgi:hypothetical protein